MKYLLAVVALLSFSHLVYSQMYKWTDEQGRIHYSQTPPPVKQEIESVQKIEKSGALLRVEPEKRGHHYYCGDVFLLSARDGDDVLHKNIKLQIRDWETALHEQEKLFTALKQPGQPYNTPQIKKQQVLLASYACRVKWGRDMLREFTSFGYEARKTNRELQQRYDYLLKRREAECPADAKRFGHILVGDAAREWYACHDGYTREMKSIKSKMADNIRAIKAANP